MIKNDYGPGSGRFLEHEHSSSSQHPHKWKVKMILFCWFRRPLEHKYSSSPAPAKMENKNDHRGRRSVMTMLTILLLESHYLLSQWFWEHNLTLLWLGINLSISQKKLFKIIFQVSWTRTQLLTSILRWPTTASWTRLADEETNVTIARVIVFLRLRKFTEEDIE